MNICRVMPRSISSLSLYRAIFFCVVFSMGREELIAQTATPTVPTQDQKPMQEGGAQPQMGGVNTGGAHAAVLDAEHRPITAGGFVKSGPVIFQDIAQKAGLTTWKHTMGTPEKRYIIETNLALALG